MSGKYYFFPWVRRGALTRVKAIDTLGESMPALVRQSAHLRVNDRVNTQEIPIRLHGPGDVKGINKRMVIRTDPHAGVKDFEPNYFPLVDFDLPDFPWLFTPASADTQDRLRPWICLVVVPVIEGISIAQEADQPLPVLDIRSPAQPGLELPDLSESWAWAHAQLVSSAANPSLKDLLAESSAKNCSRLICPRKLKPNQAYHACLVPAFAAGRKTGLGLPLSPEDESEFRPAWLSGEKAPEAIKLPVYYHWSFSTATQNDFESLVTKLEGRQQLPGVGTRPMMVRDLPFELPDAGLLPLGGALQQPRAGKLKLSSTVGLLMTIQLPPVALGQETILDIFREAFARRAISLSEYAGLSQEENKVFQIEDLSGYAYSVIKLEDTFYIYDLPNTFPDKLRDLLQHANKWEEDTGEPIVAPPLYGGMQASHQSLPRNSEIPLWLEQLNLDPRYRAVAGLGTLVVQDQQDQLVAAAWEQLQDNTINQYLNHLHFTLEVNQATFKKRFAGADSELALQMMEPIQHYFEFQQLSAHTGARYQVRSMKSKAIRQRASTIPSGRPALPKSLLSPAFRRIARKRGVLMNRIRYKATAAAPILTGYLDMIASTQAAKPEEDSGSTAEPGQGGGAQGSPGEGFVVDPAPATATAQDTINAIQQNQLENLSAQENIFQLMMGQVGPAGGEAETTTSTLSRAIAVEEEAPPVPTGLPLALKTAPLFPYPMYHPLKEISQELLLPGLEHIPDNTIALLETNPRFVEAYMAGLNHEMSRELLWRDFPTDPRASYFPHFWDQLGNENASAQVPPIHQWDPKNALGENLPSVEDKEQLVLLIRGELLRRFPSAIIYLLQTQDPTKIQDRGMVQQEAYPAFRGKLEPDISFLGFNLTLDAVQNEEGWYFVIQEQPTEPRFGLDVASAPGGKPDKWSNLHWGHLLAENASTEALNELGYVSLSGRLRDWSVEGVKWGHNATHMAQITLQKPYMMIIPAHSLLSPQPENDGNTPG